MTYIPMMFYFVGRAIPVMAHGSDTEIYNRIGRLLNGVFFCFLLLAVVGIILYFCFPGIEKNVAFYVGTSQSAYFIIRMTSIVWSPIIFGFLMSITTTFYFFMLMQKGDKKYYLYIAITWLALSLSVCRGGILSFLIGFIIITFFFRNDWRRALQSFILISLIICSVSLVARGDFAIVKWIFTSSKDTAQMTTGVTRVNLWEESMESIRRKPMGYGIGKAGWTAFEYMRNSSDAAPYSTDGWYIKTACEIGVYGLAAYLLMTIAFLFNVFKFVRRRSTTMLTFCMVSIIIVHAQNVVSNVLDFYPYVTIYWLLLGLSQGIVRLEKTKAPEATKAA